MGANRRRICCVAGCYQRRCWHFGAQGVLVGAAVVTLLAGCLGLANLYLASIERRFRELKLLTQLGLSQFEVILLLLVETLQPV